MNRIQSLFKHKHKTKSRLLLSIVAMLLIITLLPLTALGADGDMITLGVTTKGNSYNGSGVAGRTYGSDPERIWGKMTSDSTGKSQTAYDLIGYRVYIVDKAGNLQSKVVDLTYRNPTDYSNKQDYTTTILCGTVDKSDVANVKQVKAIRDKNKVMNINSDTPEVFIARNGDYIVGQDLAHWMQVTDSNGHTNSRKIIEFTFEGEDVLTKIKDTKYAKDTQDWQVIVEPLMYVDIWTQNCELVEFEETTEYEWYKEHCIVTRGDQAVDVCCSSTSDYRVTQSSKELLNYCAEMGTYLMAQRPLLYGTSKLTGGYATKLTEYYNAVSAGEANEKEAARQLGYGNNRAYNSLNDNEKIAVYNKLVSTGKALNPNTLYIKSKSEGIAYNVVNKVDNGNGEYVYADYSIAYKHKTGSNWDWVRPVTKNGKTYHVLSAYTGDRLYSTYTGVKNHLKTVPKLASTTPGSDGGCTKGKINDIGAGMHLSEEMVFTDASGKPTKTLAAGTNGIHMYPLSDIYDFGKPIHTYDVDTKPNTPAKSEQPKEDKQNTGSTTIVKVYGHIYKDDSGKIHHINHKDTFVTTQATNEIIITDEYTQTGYKLTEWVATTTTSNKTNIKATDWATVTTDLKLSTNKMKNTLGVQSYSYSSSANGLTHGEDNPITIGNEEDNNTIYLLYLKSLPYIETSDKKVPDNETQYEPNNPTKPENPSNDKSGKNNPDKKGSFNIIKLYALLDEYDGTPLSYEVYEQKSTTPFIKIESESNWTLASWYTTDKFNQSVTANDFLQKATSNATVYFTSQKHIIQKSR